MPTNCTVRSNEINPLERFVGIAHLSAYAMLCLYRHSAAEWVDRVQTNDATYTQRQITEIILHAISMTPFLSRRLYLKGGVLMGLVYDSPRQTSDIDFSTSPDYLPDNQTTDELRKYLDGSLPRAAATLGYIDTVLRVQSINEQPHKWHPGISFSFPALEVKIGYAIRGTPQEKQLERKEASNVVPLDINFNEKTSRVQILKLADNETLLAYSLKREF